MKSIAVSFAVILIMLSIADAKPPVFAKRSDPDASFSWLDQITKKVPLLRHERGKRWPMILWECGPLEPQSPEIYKALLARGLTQHIHLDEKMIPIAQVLQSAGSPVIMMQGAGGSWPFSLAGEPSEWAHQFDPGFEPSEAVHACPEMTKGWAINADQIRATLEKFKKAGVTVNAVWMDWEVDPAMGSERYEQATHCARCRATIPAHILADRKTFHDYCSRRNMDLIGAYLAAPVAEIFPGCSTTNWRAVVSTPDHPAPAWGQTPPAHRVPPMVTATNPVAYGMTMFFRYWKPSFQLDREHVDQFYTHLVIRDVSNDTANRLIWAPEKSSIPWVCRWCDEGTNPAVETPILTRERYREVLRHLWLRGISGMQVFNPKNAGFEEIAVGEVQDAVMIYDEMLEYREFLESGTPLCLAVPKLQDDGVLWSGLRLGDRALVRTFKQGGSKGTITVEPWPGRRVQLQATPAGKTYVVVLKDGRVSISR